MPPAYQPFAGHLISMYEAPSDLRLANEDDVAASMLEAATDRSTRLRFTVGEDVALSARMRRETSEGQYNAWTSARFA